jgi:hypothetical protein
MRLLTEGFEQRTLENFPGGTATFTTNGRINGLAADTTLLTFPLVENNEFYTRFAYAIRGGNLAEVVRFQVRDSNGTTVLRINFGHMTPITVYLNNAAQPIAQIAQPMNMNWYVFEIHYRFTDQAGGASTFERKRDGILLAQTSVATAQVTQPPFTGKLGYLDFGAVGKFCLLDDIAVNDTTGTQDNSWCGDGHIIALVPNANGDRSEFIGSDGNSVDNYLLVDEFPVNLSGGTGDYVESLTPGAADLYQVGNPVLKSGDVIQRVWVYAQMREQSADGDTVQLGGKSNGVEFWGDPIALGVSFRPYNSEEYLVNPGTGSAWTQQNITDLQIGVKNS